MSDKGISVIVPAYNCEKTIEKCIESILAQTIIGEIEIIIVNDGSTDSTLSILNQYKNKFPDKICIVNQKNSGPAAARNRGINVASGVLIGFVDADDYIEPDMYEVMKQRMSEDIDLVMCGRFNTFSDGTVKVKKNKIDYDETCVADNPALLSRISTFVWDKLYKKDLIINNNICFPEKYHYAEDFYFVQKYILTCDKVGVVENPFYHYHLDNPNSITGKCDKRWLDICRVLRDINEMCITNGTFKKYENELLYSSAGFYCRRIRTLKNHKNKAMQIRFIWAFIRYFEKYFKGKWERVVHDHRIKTARGSRTRLTSMVKYILKL